MAEPPRHAIGPTRPGHYGARRSGVAIARSHDRGGVERSRRSARAPFVDEVRRAVRHRAADSPEHDRACSARLTAIWLGPRRGCSSTGGASRARRFRREARCGQRGRRRAVRRLRQAASHGPFQGRARPTVLAKSCPLDFRPLALAPGSCAQSLLGHVNALFVKHDDAPTFTVMVARSFARDVWHSLLASAAQYGVDIGPATLIAERHGPPGVEHGRWNAAVLPEARCIRSLRVGRGTRLSWHNYPGASGMSSTAFTPLTQCRVSPKQLPGSPTFSS